MASNDRILVSTSEMMETIQKYNNARDVMNDAFSALQSAMDILDTCWKGPAWAAYLAKWLMIFANLKRSDEAMQKAITGLTNTIQIMDDATQNINTQTGSLETGNQAPIF